MALMLKNGAIFLHVPKTGGSWVTAVLKDQGLVKYPIGHIHADLHRVMHLLSPGASVAHVLSAQAKMYLPLSVKKRFNPNKKVNRAIWNDHLPEEDKTPFFFCFVRHPVNWYESIWRYLQKHGFPYQGRQYDVHRWHPLSMLNGLVDQDFNQFVANVIEQRPGFVTEMLGWYTMPGVNFVGRQESLEEDLVTVLRIMKLDFDEQGIRQYGRVNVAPQQIKARWDPGLREEILEIERVALIRYGYLQR